MQYLVSVIDDTTNSGTEEEMVAIDDFNDRLRAGGHWVFAAGLAAPETATVIDGRGEEPVFTDGPFIESKEHMAGFWIIDAPDLDVALALMADGSKACNRRLEVRPFLVRVSPIDARAAITRAHHEEWARVVASLAKRFGDLDIAEEAAAEAFATAVERWPADGVPPNPGGWLTTTANRKAIDRIRREHKRDDKHREALMLSGDDPPEPLGAIDDDRLRLIFTCCHPALAMEARVALTLRMVGGLTVPEIARGFLVQERAMGQRITRAKGKIAAAGIPYRVPSARDLPARITGVLAVLFLVFNEGYLATGPDTDPVRPDLTAEAIRLTRLVRALLPEDGEVAGLLALMLLTEARRPARVSADGELVALGEQDRGAWDAALIEEGHRLVRERLCRGGSRALPAARRDQRRAHRRARRPRHRLVAGRRPLRPAGPPRPLADRRPQPRRRGRRARRSGRRVAVIDRLGTRSTVSRLPRHPRRAAARLGRRGSRARPTTGPSRSPATPPRSPTCRAVATNSLTARAGGLPRSRGAAEEGRG